MSISTQEVQDTIWSKQGWGASGHLRSAAGETKNLEAILMAETQAD